MAAAAARSARWWLPPPPHRSSAASARTGRRSSADWAGLLRSRWWARRSSAQGLLASGGGGACAFLSSGSGPSNAAWNDAAPGPAWTVSERSSDDGVRVSLVPASKHGSTCASSRERGREGDGERQRWCGGLTRSPTQFLIWACVTSV
ncbi:hypothetical protein PAHAL_6G056100 [Panicum hallii]|uniref:Uncharacterized protein n=1 Tax=Panicum hallii TaxID=206008 RepID=A0A2S3I0N9_9POAL|nr:hypothetical protein PAHAL_6G056100 [Panicum hallii]